MSERFVHGDVDIELWHNYKKYLVQGADIDQGAQAILMPDGTIYDLRQMIVLYECDRDGTVRFLAAPNSRESVWGKLPKLQVVQAQSAD